MVVELPSSPVQSGFPKKIQNAIWKLLWSKGIDHITTLRGEKVNRKMGIKSRTAQKSDQAKTPDWVFDLVKKKLFINNNQIYDPNLYRNEWNGYYYFCGLTTPLPLMVLWENPPFKIGAAFLANCLVEYLNGKDLVLLLPCMSLWSDFYRDYVKPVTVRLVIGSV
jgi:hypothetical protein